ncbi:MAG: ABC transporter permease subunit [Verrucomicrobiota bacterium]
MNLLWPSILLYLAAMLAAWALATLAARIRFSARRGLRVALDVLFLLPLAFPSATPGYAIIIPFLFKPVSQSMLSVATGVECLFLLPIFYLCAVMGFRRVDRETIEAARLQGVGRCGIFWRVFGPVAWPWLVAGFALGWFRIAFLLTFLQRVS